MTRAPTTATRGPKTTTSTKPEAVASARAELEKIKGTIEGLRERLGTLG